MTETESVQTTENDDKLGLDAPELEATATAVPRTAVLAAERAQEDVKREPRDPANPLSVRELFEAGAHFGHQTKRWNPKMRQFIYGSRSGIHIIDLDQTSRLFKRAFDFLADTVSRGGHVLFVGTKRQAAEIVQEEAQRAGQYYVTNRWLGGTLTNFRTIKGGLERLRSLERMREDGTYEQIPKKETVKLDKERARHEKYIGGLKGMGSLPSAVFIIDPAQESIAINEARKLKIPVVAITDTNCDPDLVDYVIPGNDDAIRSIRLICGAVADACIYGSARRRDHQASRDRDGGQQPSAQPDAQVIYSRNRA
ncbi:MAG: 30S ribosomal protein S2 [Myxococcales bacterium]|nr:30S ribosomal protein S2 [Myxococcales bacterium]MCB9577473.1 30S ribosomal protein S2 [Polyangiaceae bacterium]